MASRSHCVIEKVGDTFRLRDLNSSNGTRLNGQLVRSAVMNNGDVISIGRTTLKLVVPGAPIDMLGEEDLVEAPAEKSIDQHGEGGMMHVAADVDYEQALQGWPNRCRTRVW